MNLLDANVLIRAKNEYYGIDFVPGFWDWLSDEFRSTGIRSISAVRDELLAQDDLLSDWARALPEDFWLEEQESDTPSLRKVADWAMTAATQYVPRARTDFLAKADYRLVALSAAGGHTIVTHEVSAPDAQKSIKIPDAATAFRVACREPFGLFRELGLMLVRPT